MTAEFGPSVALYWLPLGAGGHSVRLTDDPCVAQRVLDLVRDVPTPVWGRDELDAGEMWNSNSLSSWLIVRSGLDAESIEPPAGGRAPGWDAGLVGARRQEARPPPGFDPTAAARSMPSILRHMRPER